MPAHPNPQEPTTPDTPATPDPEHRRAVLRALLDLGATLAHQVHGQAMAQAALRPEANSSEAQRDAAAARTATLVAAFDRAARAVRRTVLLAQHLDDAPRAHAARTHARAQAQAEAQAAHMEARTHARTRILRGVEDALDRAAHARRPTPDATALRRELLERLDAPDLHAGLDADLARRPLADVIAEICRDLGLAAPVPFSCPPRRRTPADLAALHAQATAPPGTLRPAAPAPTPTLTPALPPGPPPGIPPDLPPAIRDALALCAALAPDG